MRQLRRAVLYLDAARRVRPRQAAGRLRRHVPPRLLAVGISARRDVQLGEVAAGITTSAVPQSGQAAPPHERGVFRAVGRERAWGAAGFWNDESDGLLFLFHLHGFDGLARYAGDQDARSGRGDAFWRGVVTDWLHRHARPDYPAWHPFPLSNRLIALCAAAPVLGLQEEVADAVFRQARYLSRAMEHDIGGNHVLKNAAALAIAALAFDDHRLQRRAERLLRAEAARQFLPDGGHEERSPSYHREALHDLDNVAQVFSRAGRQVPGWLDVTRASAADWLSAMAGPDGSLPLLNDAWEGPAVADRAAEPVTLLEASGYAVLRHGGDQLVFDAGPLSPPHLPPHAHADALSFVLWADGRPLVVDPGSHLYTGPTRDHFRGTQAHNTVAVEGADQCHFWGDFRLAHPPNVVMYPPRQDGPVWVLGGEHDGYGRLSPGLRHERRVVWWPQRGLVVIDRLAGRGEHDVVSSLHLAPGADTGGTLHAGPLAVAALGGGEPRVEKAEYSPYLGIAQPIEVIRDRRRVAAGDVFGWALLRDGARVAGLGAACVQLADAGDAEVSVPLEWGG